MLSPGNAPRRVGESRLYPEIREPPSSSEAGATTSLPLPPRGQRVAPFDYDLRSDETTR